MAVARDLGEALDVAVRDFVALHGAEMGDLQLAAADGNLVIVAARGVSRAFLQTFGRVSMESGSVCGQAARDRKPTFIADVGVDPEFAPYRAFAASEPFRSVLSYPLMAANGKLLGMLSALSSHPFWPTALELETARAYCGQLSTAIEKAMAPEELPGWAEARSAALLESSPEKARRRTVQ